MGSFLLYPCTLTTMCPSHEGHLRLRTSIGLSMAMRSSDCLERSPRAYIYALPNLWGVSFYILVLLQLCVLPTKDIFVYARRLASRWPCDLVIVLNGHLVLASTHSLTGGE